MRLLRNKKLFVLPVLLSILFFAGCAVIPKENPHFLGNPGQADRIVKREGYTLGYRIRYRQAAWVSYRLTAEQLARCTVPRSNIFMADPDIRESAQPSDYTRSGYDRGHLAPAADMAFSVKAMNESFYMTNMSPQHPRFNRDIWKKLESQVRSFAKTEKDIFVITGPVLRDMELPVIGKNRVAVPRQYYKVVYDRTPPEKMIGFILPNRDVKGNLRSYVVTVDAVEEATGLDFFSVLPEEKQRKLESEADPSLWKWLTPQPGT